MKSKTILSQLSELENSLSNFSFEELSSEEAGRLQKTFLTFKTQLENKVWGEAANEPKGARSGINPETFPDTEKKDMRRVALACHQMRTPLNALAGLSDMLKESSLSPEQAYQVHAIQTAQRGLMNMLTELTEYSRLFAGLEAFEQIGFNFHNLIRDVEYLCSTLIVNKQLSFLAEIDPAIPKRLSGDPSKLSQILLHLLGETLKAGQDGQITLDVTFHHQDGDQVFLEFVISGVPASLTPLPIPAGKRQRPRVDTALENAGDTGLGISIVSRLVELLGGEFFLQPATGGSRDYAFRLPFFRAGQEPAGKRQDAETSLVQGMRILVLDTDLLDRNLMERRLKSWGCIPYVTATATQALSRIEGSFDLIILTMRPGKEAEATTFTDAIQQATDPALKAIPLLGIISVAGGELIQTDYRLQAPFQAEELFTNILHSAKEGKNDQKLPSSLNGNEVGPSGAVTIDLSSQLEDCYGKMDTLEELVVQYKQKSLEFIGSVKLHLGRADFSGISYACQKVLGSLKWLQAGQMESLASQMLKSSRSNQDLRYLKFLHQCFVEEYPVVEAALDRALQSLKDNH